MAYTENKFCGSCDTETLHFNGGCGECAKREEREKVALWEAGTIEQKLSDLRIRIEKLENGPDIARARAVLVEDQVRAVLDNEQRFGGTLSR